MDTFWDDKVNKILNELDAIKSVSTYFESDNWKFISVSSDLREFNKFLRNVAVSMTMNEDYHSLLLDNFIKKICSLSQEDIALLKVLHEEHADKIDIFLMHHSMPQDFILSFFLKPDNSTQEVDVYL